MSRTAKLFAANAIAAAGLCSAALALSPGAAAEPAAPPAVPGIPALTMLQQFASNPASALGLLQGAASALNGATGGLTGAPSTLPVSPITGAPGVATLPAAPVTAPVAPAAPATGNSLLPMLNQLGVPGGLAGLAPSNLGLAPAPVNAPVQLPASTQPVAPTAPGSAPLGDLSLLSALP
ncbi:MAG: hypothetical protein H6522_02470 [Mycolicibacterium sp.]|jgi:hypothetical protein|nr:hypothetical protein [Mycolicibacterium sp.]TXI52323.1 MAG: hypothetical protein E6Q57_05145 [Mycobacterium sp.]